MPDRREPPQLVLASASPRRLDLLKQAGLAPDLTEAPAIDERAGPAESPPRLGSRLARGKASAVASRHPGAYRLAADTVVAGGRRH
ncbi:MAG: Maf family protein, partial [Alphaproteobacteria bacterium]|nr:Maf family protein [Alphaproteobacteria bacterium]